MFNTTEGDRVRERRLYVGVRLSAQELADVDMLAAAGQVSRSEMIRRLLAEGIRACGARPVDGEKQPDD